MERAWHGLNGIIKVLERSAVALAVLALVAVMMVSVLDVFMRYAVHKPFVWSYPVIANYILVALVFLSISDTQATGHHVGVDVVVRRMRPVARGLLQALSSVAVLLIALVVAIPAFGHAEDAYIRNDVVPGIISWPKWPSHAVTAVGMGILALRAVTDVLGGLLAVGGGVTAGLHEPQLAERGE